MAENKRRRNSIKELGCVRIINQTNTEHINFICIPERCVYSSDNYKVYGVSIDKIKYPDIKLSQYGTATIIGDIPSLMLGSVYEVEANLKQDKNGWSYQVFNIRRQKPMNEYDTRVYLEEILTINQVNTLLSVYPNILDMVLNDKEIDVSKLKGIGETIFRSIKTKIIENFKLSELITEYHNVFSMSILKKLYEKYTSISKVKHALKSKPYECLCSLGGIGFATADELLLTIEKQQNTEKPIIVFTEKLVCSYQRMKACVDYILSANETAGHTYMTSKEFLTQCKKLASEAIGHLPKIIKSSEVHFNGEMKAIADNLTFDTELYIANRLLEANHHKDIWQNINFEKYRSNNGAYLTDEQMKVLTLLSENQISILNGNAGSGKSFLTNAVIKMLIDHNKSFQLMSPTGRAAKVLSNYTNQPASTIHRGLRFIPPNTWTFNSDNPLSCDVLIVDESSMIDIFLFKHLLEAIDFTKTKLLLIGDDAQLPSVGAGNILYDLLNSNVIPKVTLTQIFRYGTGGLSTIATQVRNSEKYLSVSQNKSPQVFGEDKAYIFNSLTQEKGVTYIAKLYKTFLNKGYSTSDMVVLSAYNKGEYGTVKINSKIQSLVNSNSAKEMKCGEVTYRIGDPVIQIQNDYKATVYDKVMGIPTEQTEFIPNGEIGKIYDIQQDKLIVQYDDVYIFYTQAKLINLKLAYAISTHKSQGGQFKTVILFTPKAHTYMLNSNLLYVGVSRASEKCIHIGEVNTVNTAIKKKENFKRNTFLLHLLKQKNEIL